MQRLLPLSLFVACSGSPSERAATEFPGHGGSPGQGGAVPVSAGSAGSSGTERGMGAAAGSSGNGNAEIPGQAGGGGQSGSAPDRVPGLVAVGYGGIRIVSRDGGLSWADRDSFAVDGGDDENLLRAVVFGDGLWIATGWKLVTSTDGVAWTDHGLINELDGMPPCNVIEGLAHDGTAFYAACTPWNEPGKVYVSSDGFAWSEHGTIGDTQGHLFLTFRAGQFVAYGDTLTTFVSPDAQSWTVLPGVERGTYCEGEWRSEDGCFSASWFEGAYLRSEWKGKITRSTDGGSFEVVYTDDEENSVYQARAIAPGEVAP